MLGRLFDWVFSHSRSARFWRTAVDVLGAAILLFVAWICALAESYH